eukprot:scaffold466043_cov36-Prasinocladus_malaysianus.AAC.1
MAMRTRMMMFKMMMMMMMMAVIMAMLEIKVAVKVQFEVGFGVEQKHSTTIKSHERDHGEIGRKANTNEKYQ